jgi:hypothetical protein
LVLLFVGCAVPTPKPVRTCPGKKTPDEAIAALNSRLSKIAPLRASGQCLLSYHLDNKPHKENFPVKLWVNPPGEIYLQGDVAFDATGLVLGANADEFWFWLKPKEISSYWWGAWAQTGMSRRIPLNPMVLLEAFGAVGVSQGDWSLTHANFDILWLHNEQGVLLKRIFIEPCDYVVAKIEYFDSSGAITATAEFSGYKQIAEGYLVPESIQIVVLSADGVEDSARISLTSVRPAQFNADQRRRLFVRPPPRGFDHVYEIIDGEVVEQIIK